MGLMSSCTGVRLGSRPLRANFASTSRSVNMPATMPCSSMTATAPTCFSNIVRIASSTVACRDTVAGPSSHHFRRLMIVKVLPTTLLVVRFSLFAVRPSLFALLADSCQLSAKAYEANGRDGRQIAESHSLRKAKGESRKANRERLKAALRIDRHAKHRIRRIQHRL